MSRDQLLAFATWLADGEHFEGREAELVDKYMAEQRATVAWLLWCANEGYVLAEDRAILDSPNMFQVDPSTLHPDDRRELSGWLQMADQVLTAIGAGRVVGEEQ